MRLNCCSKVVESGARSKVVVLVGCLEIVEDSRFDVVEVVVGACRRVLDVVDIIDIKIVNI
jgi:hypothetical protein